MFSLKYRPSTFDELAGQPHVRQTIVNTLVRKQVGHGYIFSGPRGVGKTSAARLFAKALNCVSGPGPNICNKCDPCREIASGNCLDVIEMDGASNRKIEDVRALRENVRFAPTTCRYKIYIIDEVHMLTTEAFNALLKTLEEPPEHVVFILATTDPQKIPETIHSRCQELEFHRLSAGQLEELFRLVCKKEKITLDAESARKLSEWADGSARDALVALEQAAAFCEGEITEDKVDRLFGWVERETIEAAIRAVMTEDQKAIFALAREIEDSGKDISHFMIQMARTLRQSWLKQGEADVLRECDPSAMIRMISVLLEAERNLRVTRQPALFLAVKLIELMEVRRAVPLSALVRRLEELETRVAGSPSPPDAPSAVPAARQPARQINPAGSGRRNRAAMNPAEKWTALKEAVGAEDVQMLAWIREGRPVSWSEADKVLTVNFSTAYAIHHEKVSAPRSRSLLDACLSKVMGEPGWRLDAKIENQSPPPGAAEAGDVPGGVRMAMEMFEGRVVNRHE